MGKRAAHPEPIFLGVQPGLTAKAVVETLEYDLIIWLISCVLQDILVFILKLQTIRSVFRLLVLEAIFGSHE